VDKKSPAYNVTLAKEATLH